MTMDKIFSRFDKEIQAALIKKHSVQIRNPTKQITEEIETV